MMKKGFAYILAICMGISPMVGYAEEEAPPLETENQQIEQQAEVPDFNPELQQFEDGLVDRYIIKYQQTISVTDLESAPLNIQSQAVKAFSTALEETVIKRNEIKRREQELVYESNDVSHSTLQKSLSPMSMATVSEWKDGYGIISLGQAVEPEVFIGELSDSVEYIQPDYKLEFASKGTVNVELALAGTEEADGEQPSPEEVPELFKPELTTGPEVTETPKIPGMPVATLEPTETPTAEPTLSPEETQVPEETTELEPTEQPALSAKVALIDGGVDITHDALKGHIIDPWDFVKDEELTYDETISDQYYHGTHVAGIIAQTAPNAVIMPLKVFDQGKAYTSDIVDAIQYAEKHGATIVNCSWGSTDNNEILKEAMEQADMLFICAAGNNRVNLRETPIYPACFDLENILSVTSTNSDSGLSYFSNYGDVDIAAIGREITSAWPGNQYGEMSGTSMAAGAVTGVAALIFDTGVDVKDRLLSTADKYIHLIDYINQGRMLNLQNAIDCVENPELQDRTYHKDFNQNGYADKIEDNWELYSSLPNKQVAVGKNHVLVLKEDGSVWGWGSNKYGQLGIGATFGRGFPIRIPIPYEIQFISCSKFSSFAVTTKGECWAWGNNVGRQLGDSTASQRAVPMRVIGISNVKKIYTGSNTVFAETADGKIWSWGTNSSGEMGIGNTISTGVPTLNENISNVQSIVCGEKHVLILNKNNELYACGNNMYGQLGTGDDKNQKVPIKIMENVKCISADENKSAAYTEDGDLYCWGGSSRLPKKTDAFDDVSMIACGKNHFALIRSDGTVWSKGYNNWGQLGIGNTSVAHDTFVETKIKLDAEWVGTGEDMTVVLGNGKNIYTWGRNTYGQIGNGTYPIENELRPSHKLRYMTKVINNYGGHFMAIDEMYRVWAWGANWLGQLGDGTKTDRSSPVLLTEINYVDDIVTTYGGTVALRKDGSVWQWGEIPIADGKSPEEIQNIHPKKVEGLEDIVAISAGMFHVMALKSDGTAWIWGENVNGALGNLGNIIPPTQLTEFTDVAGVAASGFDSYVLLSDGSVWNYSKSKKIIESGAVELVGGFEHMFAIMNDGRVCGWGGNSNGQIGIPSLGTEEPTFISNLTNVIKVKTSRYGSMVKCSDGKIYAFGSNYNGSLGLINSCTYYIPVEINTKYNFVDFCLSQDGNSFLIDENGFLYELGTKQAPDVLEPCCIKINTQSEGDVHNVKKRIYVGKTVTDSFSIEDSEKWYIFKPYQTNTYKFNIEIDVGSYILQFYDAQMNQFDVDNNQAVLSYPNEIYIRLLFRATSSDMIATTYTITVTCEQKQNESQCFITRVGNNTYYSNLTDGGKLYKDGTKIMDNPVTWICNMGDVVYFNSECSVYRLENNIPSKIIDVNAFFLTCDSNTIYFANWSDGGKLYACSISGGTLEKISDDIGAWLRTDDTYLYYFNSLDSGELYKINKSARGAVSGEKV